MAASGMRVAAIVVKVRFATSLLAAGAVAAMSALAGGAPARASTTASLTPSFVPDRLGARGAVTLALHYKGEFGGTAGPSLTDPLVPEPVSRVVVRFPAGMGPDIPNLRGCAPASLRARGARGCPASTRMGGGRALTEIHPSTVSVTEGIALQAFIGPVHDGRSTLEILGLGYTPLEERLVITGEMLFGHAPYGEELVMTVPPIATLPMEPSASTVDFTLTIGSPRPGAGGARNTVIVPRRCPAGGFPFAAEFTYADGSTSSARAAAPCP